MGRDRDRDSSHDAEAMAVTSSCAKLLMHSWHFAHVLLVSVARQRILICHAWLSQLLGVERKNLHHHGHHMSLIWSITKREVDLIFLYFNRNIGHTKVAGSYSEPFPRSCSQITGGRGVRDRETTRNSKWRWEVEKEDTIEKIDR